MATLAEIRAKLQAQDSKNQNNSNQSRGADALYPFWNADVDTTSVIRFLPDADTSNDFFWRERQVIKMPFPGVKGVAESKPVTVQVPCVEMWGDQCPVHAEIRPWYKDPSMEKLAGKYWKKRSYIFQGFVVEDAVNEKETPENPIRRFVISSGIFKVIKAGLMDPDMDNLPVSIDSGTDFRIVKTQNGQYADYGTSNYARRERSLNEVERQAIETHGLCDLNDFMPKRPSAEELEVIMQMFEASVDGELYDPERWGNFYRPYGVELEGVQMAPNTSRNSTSAATPSAPVVASPAPVSAPTPPRVSADDIPFASTEEAARQLETADAAPAKPKQDASDILAMIRNRKTD